MDIEKEREAFSRWVLTHPDNREITAYEENIMFDAWQAAKAQAVPDGFVLVPISLLKDINSIAVNEFHKWKIKEEQMPEICEYMQDLSFYIGVEK